MRTALWMIPVLLTTSTGLAAAQDMKVAYVDMAQALNDVEDGKSAKGKLKADFDVKQKKLDELQTQFKAKQEDFEKKKAMMKEDVRQAKRDELEKDFMQLQQTYSQLQRELIDAEGKVTQEISTRLKAVIEKIGDRDSYTLIINIGDTVLYYKRHQDITAEVVKEYNRQYGKQK
ncbi:MAG: OmpH family outer membrane protein [Deltaproteobacteria bacterium]|nr:OmpH family outer membrane protein [Deltaproteobacteria bacterium]